jgi:hypothetical protein
MYVCHNQFIMQNPYNSLKSYRTSNHLPVRHPQNNNHNSRIRIWISTQNTRKWTLISIRQTQRNSTRSRRSSMKSSIVIKMMSMIRCLISITSTRRMIGTRTRIINRTSSMNIRKRNIMIKINRTSMINRIRNSMINRIRNSLINRIRNNMINRIRNSMINKISSSLIKIRSSMDSMAMMLTKTLWRIMVPKRMARCIVI